MASAVSGTLKAITLALAPLCDSQKSLFFRPAAMGRERCGGFLCDPIAILFGQAQLTVTDKISPLITALSESRRVLVQMMMFFFSGSEVGRSAVACNAEICCMSMSATAFGTISSATLLTVLLCDSILTIFDSRSQNPFEKIVFPMFCSIDSPGLYRLRRIPLDDGQSFHVPAEFLLIPGLPEWFHGPGCRPDDVPDQGCTAGQRVKGLVICGFQKCIMHGITDRTK